MKFRMWVQPDDVDVVVRGDGIIFFYTSESACKRVGEINSPVEVLMDRSDFGHIISHNNKAGWIKCYVSDRD